MSSSDSDASSESVSTLDTPSVPDQSPVRPRQTSYPRRQSSLSDARYPDHRASTSTSFASGRDGSAAHLPPTLNTHARRDIITAMDRKRRLTSSAQDHGRRRQTPMGLADRSFQELIDSDEEAPSADRPSANFRPPQREVVDLTASSPPLQPSPHLHQRPSRASSSSSRRYVVPRWQADSEVSECPICGRTFTWLFRRHHCRKCGRVVCNDCSPHRITIPRQYIVSPPSPEAAVSPTRTDGFRNETIDLTGEDDDEGEGRSSRRNWEGGEKVRLCNPCVPDPQPEPLPYFPPSLERVEAGVHPRTFGSTPFADGARQNPHASPLSQLSRHRPGMFSSFTPAPFNPSTSMPGRAQHFGPSGGHPRPSSITTSSGVFPPGFDPRFGLHNNPLPPLPANGPLAASMYGHGRYASLDSRSRPPEPYRRPRGSSMFDQQLRDFGTTPPVPRGSRPRLNEEDICPVCRRALPPKGPTGDESEREAHIIGCISARDPTSGSAGEGSSSRPSTLHMVSFTASEKDCVGEDGNIQECSICMVEYSPGDELARLECFCKFHKECIVSWLNRKAECPVHKATSMHF